MQTTEIKQHGKGATSKQKSVDDFIKEYNDHSKELTYWISLLKEDNNKSCNMVNEVTAYLFKMMELNENGKDTMSVEEMNEFMKKGENLLVNLEESLRVSKELQDSLGSENCTRCQNTEETEDML